MSEAVRGTELLSGTRVDDRPALEAHRLKICDNERIETITSEQIGTWRDPHRPQPYDAARFDFLSPEELNRLWPLKLPLLAPTTTRALLWSDVGVRVWGERATRARWVE